MTRRALAGLLVLGALVHGTAAAAVPEASIATAVSAEAAANVWPSGFPGSPQVDEGWEQDDWDWVDRAPEPTPSPERSPWKAVAASALLPGLGERYVGREDRSRLFWWMEGAIWTTFGFYRIQADLREDRHVEFAHVQAGASDAESNGYYEHIGFWLSMEEWHGVVRQDARIRFPDDPAAQEAFFQANKRYDESQEWTWADDETRLRYRQLRSRTERSYRNARLAAGAALFNRFASMIDALSMARSHNKRVREKHADVLLRIGPAVTSEGLVVGPILTTRY
jgi:hypothetical protein